MNLKQAALRYASELGYGKEVIEFYDAITDTFGISVDPEIRQFELDSAEQEGTVLIPVTHRERWNSHRDCILAHAFRTRGYEPLIVTCNGNLSLCRPKEPENWGYYNQLNESPALCDLCNYKTELLLDAYGLNSLDLSQFAPVDPALPELSDKEITSFSYREIPVSTFAMASVRRYLQKYNVDITNNSEREVYERFLKSALITVDVAEKLFEIYDISATLSHNCQYVDQGPYLAVSEKHDIPAYTHQAGHISEKIGMGRQKGKNRLWTFTDSDFVSNILDKPLTTKQFEEAENIMQNRITGETVPDHFYFASGSDENIDEAEEWTSTVGVFTNVIWDAAVLSERSPFDGPFDWLETTLEWAENNQSVRMIIKSHPAEARRQGKESITSWITDKHRFVPENVVFLDPETEISPYQMMDTIDTGVVYTSTVGLEMAYRGIPTIVTGDTHYRGFDFTFDPETRDEYHELLDDTPSLQYSSAMQDRAKRYFHFHFIQKHIDFPFGPESVSDFENEVFLKNIKHDRIKPGNENLDLIVERTLAGKPVVQP